MPAWTCQDGNHLPYIIPPEIAANFGLFLYIKPSISNALEAFLANTGIDYKDALIVCDHNTYAVLGERIVTALRIRSLILDNPVAEETTVQFINTHSYSALIAVGSGTINDLCKYASFLKQTPYVVFATAPSMNGYCSANASIAVNHHKKTLTAHYPKGVFCDLQVLASAPQRMIRAGLGDSLCRPTAQADWLLSHLLSGTAYTLLPFTLLAPFENELFAQSNRLLQGDNEVIALLMQTLLVSGLGMGIAGGSYPASQGEHLIAHTIDMQYADRLPFSFHGEQIGVTTLIMSDIQETILKKPLALPAFGDVKSVINSTTPRTLAKEMMQVATIKNRCLQDSYCSIQETLLKEEGTIREAILSITLPVDNLRAILLKAGAKTAPAELGWSDALTGQAIKQAKYIRDRFTFLDLL